jgi:hypothetical protein
MTAAKFGTGSLPKPSEFANHPLPPGTELRRSYDENWTVLYAGTGKRVKRCKSTISSIKLPVVIGAA